MSIWQGALCRPQKQFCQYENGGIKMKKFISLLLSLTMLLSIVSVVDLSTYADTLTTGKCGKNVTYSFDSKTGTLTIFGTGDMYDYDNDKNRSIFYHDNQIKTVVVKNGVTSISNAAFYYCTSLASVTIPDSVTDIGHYVFRGCVSLKSIGVSKENQRYISVDGVLFNKNKSWLITYPAEKSDSEYAIPNSVTSICDSAFYGCKSLTSITIPNSVTSIGSGAFEYCKSLTSVTIPNSVKIIDSFAFYNCTSLTSVTIPNSVTSIGSGAFDYCTSLASITIPNGVTNIGDGAFGRCRSLTSVTIPNSVTNIGNGAFCYCTSLTNVTIGNSVTSIGYNAFENCTNLTNITIPDSVKSIGFEAFVGCTELRNVTIGNSVKSIGNGAFNGCANLTSVTIPNSVTSIGDWAYHGCYFTSENFVNNSNVELNDSSKPTIVDSDDDGFCIKDNRLVRLRPTYAIGEVTIPNSVTIIDDCAFAGCTSLTNVTIPNSVTSIYFSAFRGCTSLTRVTIPNSVTTIGSSTFEDCTSLTSIEVSDDNKNYSSIDGVLFNKNKSWLITYPAGKTDSEYAIPNSVMSIDDSAFYGCTSLASVTIPDSVTSIGSSAFSSCTSLTSVTIPNSVTSIGSGAFDYCTSLASITIPNSVTSIGERAFCCCTSLTSITIPNSVTSIGDSAFSYCTSLTSATIPDSVTSIGEGAFYNCTSLKSIEVLDNNKNYASVDGVLFNKDKSELITYPASKTDNTYEIPNSVTSIDNEAFYYCKSLASVTIPNSVTSIGNNAFYYCKSLASVTIPDSVTSIDFSAFGNCANLNFIIYNGTKLQWNAINISSCNENLKNAIIKCTDGLIENGNTVTIDNLEYKLNDDDTAQIIGYMGESENITIPESISYEGYTFTVTSIGDSVFSNCDNLISVTIPNSVKRLGDNAFGSVKKVIYNGTDKEFFEIENIENNKNVIVAKYYDLLNDLISEIEVPYKQSEYLKITDDYLYNTIKDRINNNEEAVSKKILIKNGEFYINGMDIGELKVQYVYFPQHYDDLNGNIERLHKVYCYIYDESSWSSSSYSLDVKVKFINDSDYNKADEKYVSDFIKTLNIAKPQCYEVDYEEYKMSEIGDWKYHFSVASEYYNKLINDSSIKFVAGSGAGGYSSFLNPYFGEAGVDLAVFKNDVLYGTYYPITNYKDGVKVTGGKIIPVMTLPSDLPDNQVENYILQKLKNDWKNESHTILSVKKGAVVNGSQLKDGYMIKIAPGYHEGDYGIIIARKQNNSTSDEKPTPVPTPSPTQQVTQPTAQNDTATTSQVKKAVSKPKSTNTKKVKAAKKAISVKWKKVRGVKGYQVQVATDKKFKKNKKTVTIKKQKTTKTTVKKLKAKKKYYVRVRTYIIVNGKKVYSSWSKIKTVKTK